LLVRAFNLVGLVETSPPFAPSRGSPFLWHKLPFSFLRLALCLTTFFFVAFNLSDKPFLKVTKGCLSSLETSVSVSRSFFPSPSKIRIPHARFSFLGRDRLSYRICLIALLPPPPTLLSWQTPPPPFRQLFLLLALL